MVNLSEASTPKKFTLKRKLAAGAAVATSIAALLGVYTYFVYEWSAHNEIVTQAPIEWSIKIQVPVFIRDRIMLSPISTQSAKTKKKKTSILKNPVTVAYAAEDTKVVSVPGEPDIENMASFVHYRESGNGTAKSGHHITCRNQGLWNEIGYAPQSGFCFNSEAEGMNKLRGWLEDKKDLGVAQELCYYNTGNKLADCQYYQDYLAYTLK